MFISVLYESNLFHFILQVISCSPSWRVYKYRQKAVNFNSYFYKKFFIEFRFEFYIKIKPIESKIIYLLYMFYKLIVLYSKMFKFHLFFAGLYKKFKNYNYRVAMTITWRATRACVHCWHNYEYFMLKQCLEI
jgi:hypothetical protein